MSKFITPQKCKHIKKSFKRDVDSAWNTLLNGSNLQAEKIPSYFRGAYTVAKKLGNIKEADELLKLSASARHILDKRNAKGDIDNGTNGENK